jgi:hypothetical protein
MEQRFSFDFSRVRVHIGAEAEESARELNAAAYTVGQHIVFGPGRFAPRTREGLGLIAHEAGPRCAAVKRNRRSEWHAATATCFQ